MAYDFAEVARDIHRLTGLEPPEQEQTLARLRAAEAPTALPELVDRAAATVVRNRLGWFRRNQFFGGLQGFCILLGMPKPDAAYLVGLIQAKVRELKAASRR